MYIDKAIDYINSMVDDYRLFRTWQDLYFASDIYKQCTCIFRWKWLAKWLENVIKWGDYSIYWLLKNIKK